MEGAALASGAGRRITTINSTGTDSHGSSSVMSTDDLNCPICLDWFCEAVETQCGHSFCCACLLQVVNSAVGDEL
jgi:hypothetical protein